MVACTFSDMVMVDSPLVSNKGIQDRSEDIVGNRQHATLALPALCLGTLPCSGSAFVGTGAVVVQSKVVGIGGEI